ncbi:hypothetical protein MVEN_01387100 [Mycena venus]|uniref:DUF6535 domain-containing protein n=1 Tax=Mycena venus TaxID=2733690 RepID=A0A8H6XW72_9AGAR|nr:hypothetical protein MVEN_01387100 [Mycena venus]
MDSSLDNVDSSPPSDNEKLIKVLQSCFADLAKKQEAQAKKQEEQADKLHQAVEALKPKVPVTDRKIAFWNAYKTLADEHDRDFQQKYSTDLDTALIFAGLFSAVDSTFIIQIQQEIQPHGTPLVVLIAQNLLYVSLFSALLAALLAVLGKQWLMYYLAAGEHGTIEARGLERQRKFDGLRRWKFDAVMQIFPLLLQIGLFLFSAALSTYLWRTHVSLAITVLSLTSVGFISYMALLISAITAPDSPFQTPLAPLVAHFIPTALWRKLKASCGWALSLPLHFIHHLTAACSLYMPKSKDVLPLFLKAKSTTKKNSSTLDVPAPIFNAPFPEPSPEVPAVSWVLETSTDPRTIDVAAAMVPHLQWPSSMDASPHLSRLRDGLLSCFSWHDNDGTTILYEALDGMTLQAIHLGQAYCTLRCSLWPPDAKYNFGYMISLDDAAPELTNVVQNLNGQPALLLGTVNEPVTRWGLRIIPSLRRDSLEGFLAQFDNEIPNLDIQSFTDYLFCILSFLSSVSPCDMAWIDKRQFQGKLVEQIFVALLGSLSTNQISMDTAAKLLYLTSRLAQHNSHYVWDLQALNRQTPIFHFCSSLPHTDGWLGVVLAAGLLSEPFSAWAPHYHEDPSWIYETLECVQTLMNNDEWVNINADRVGGLFNALLYYNAPPAKKHVHILLQALSLPGSISRHAAQLFCQNNIKNWFLDEELQHILQNSSLWASLMLVFPGFGSLGDDLIALGHTLVSIPMWQPFIREKLSSWIMLFFYKHWVVENWTVVEKYNSVLSQLWTDTGEYAFVNNGEKALGLTFVALSKLWAETDFDNPGRWTEFFQILRCTIWVAVRTGYPIPHYSNEDAGITPRFIVAFSRPLYDTLIRAAAAIKALTVPKNNMTALQEIFPSKQDILGNITKIIETVANKMPHLVGDLEHQLDRYKLREQLNEEVDKIEKSLQ